MSEIKGGYYTCDWCRAKDELIERQKQTLNEYAQEIVNLARERVRLNQTIQALEAIIEADRPLVELAELEQDIEAEESGFGYTGSLL